jgi:3-hydroxyisobutyrate dehydrogenase
MAIDKVAVLGLGIMGAGMARNFLDKGWTTVVWNRTEDKAAELIGRGAIWAETPRAAAEQADLVIEIVSDDAASAGVWQGEDGILAAARPGQVLVTSASLSMDWTLKLANLCAQRGLQFLEMPVTGGRTGAETGNLQLLVGGDAAVLDQVRDPLGAISKKIYYFGGPGSGMAFKLILNTLQAIHQIGAVEAMRLAEAADLDPEAVSGALLEMGPASPVTKAVLDRMRQETDRVNFSIQWIAKDLRYCRQMAERFGLEMPLLNDVEYMFTAAEDAGIGALDWMELHRYLDFEAEADEDHGHDHADGHAHTH